jgi:hypothetical protein
MALEIHPVPTGTLDGTTRVRILSSERPVYEEPGPNPLFIEKVPGDWYFKVLKPDGTTEEGVTRDRLAIDL